MAGKLYGIGVGPGEPGLLTIKAKEVLDRCGVIAFPVKKPGEGSVALDIIKPNVDISEKSIEEFLFSMDPDDSVRERCRAENMDKMCRLLDNGEDIAMVTLGDVGVYSTYMYIDKDIRARGYETEVIPGIPSFCHGAALAGVPLMIGNEGLAVVPVAKEEQLPLAEECVKNGWSVREMERAVKQYLNPPEVLAKEKEQKNALANAELKHLVERLRSTLKTKVSLIGTDKKGRIYIDYYTRDDLDRISELLDIIDRME